MELSSLLQDAKSGSDSQGVQKEKRPDKGENCIEFDPVKNEWHKTLVKARRVISKLATEQHILDTFSCIDQTRSKVVKQQQELTRCKDAVQRCWDVCFHSPAIIATNSWRSCECYSCS